MSCVALQCLYFNTHLKIQKKAVLTKSSILSIHLTDLLYKNTTRVYLNIVVTLPKRKKTNKNKTFLR